MSLLFDRRARVTLASKLGSISEDSEGRFFNAFTHETKIENLKISFSIVKSLKKEPNSGSITIHNLAKRTRAEFQTLPAHITLAAGYGDDIETVYKGDILPGGARSRKEGTEWITETQAGTGAGSFKNARVSKSFRAGTDLKTILKETAKAAGLKLPSSIDDAKEMISQIATGVTLDGLSSKEMDKILKPHGFGYSVQDDQLQILKGDELNRAEAIIVSPDHGMVGSPELGTPEAKGKPPILRVRMFLEPALSPGGLLQVRSRDITGDFRMLRIVHTGDTHAQPWYSEIEARPI